MDLKEFVVQIEYQSPIKEVKVYANSRAHAVSLALSRYENEQDNKVTGVKVRETK